MSSVLDRKILACRITCRRFATLPNGLHPLAIAWDPTRERLWVAVDCPPGVAGITPCERGSAIGIDARGKIRARLTPNAGQFHPGDVSVGRGRIFFSDSRSGIIFELRDGGTVLSGLNPTAVARSGQGTALDSDGRHLLVSDYGRGIGWLDLQTSEATILPRQDGKPLRGVDGLVRCGSTYFGVYNGSDPGALVAIRPGASTLTFEQVVDLPDPTQVALDGERLLAVAASGWATIDKTDSRRTSGARIVAIPLSKDCNPR